MKELDSIIKKLKTGELSECQAIDEILALYTESPRFSVSLVYIRNISSGQEIVPILFITDAKSEEEALGKAIVNFSEKMNSYNLTNTLVLKHN